jgi:hypothetical protein
VQIMPRDSDDFEDVVSGNKRQGVLSERAIGVNYNPVDRS